MQILFDQGTPVPLRQALAKHEVATAYERGWSALKNGELLRAAEAEFDVLITTDQSLSFQQNLAGRRLAILILPYASWPKLQTRLVQISAAVDELKPGDVVELPEE